MIVDFARNRWLLPLTMLLAAVFVADASGQSTGGEGGRMTIKLSSSAFAPETSIPVRYTCEGEDISPPLEWSNVPEGVKSFALLVEDPDAPAGIWVHWVHFDIPASSRSLPEAVPAGARLPDGSIQGIGSSRRNRFQGPCPPSGRHRYYFKLYALDRMLDLTPATDKQALLAAMKGHVLAEGQLMGYFSR